jgi:hypothetical protein
MAAVGAARELWSPSVFAAVHRNVSVAVSSVPNLEVPGGRGYALLLLLAAASPQYWFQYYGISVATLWFCCSAKTRGAQ